MNKNHKREREDTCEWLFIDSSGSKVPVRQVQHECVIDVSFREAERLLNVSKNTISLARQLFCEYYKLENKGFKDDHHALTEVAVMKRAVGLITVVAKALKQDLEWDIMSNCSGLSIQACKSSGHECTLSILTAKKQQQHCPSMRRKLQLVDRVKTLSNYQQGEIVKIMSEVGIKHSQNSNGYFFDIRPVDEDLLCRLESFVEHCEHQNKVDRCLLSNEDQTSVMFKIHEGLQQQQPNKVMKLNIDGCSDDDIDDIEALTGSEEDDDDDDDDDLVVPVVQQESTSLMRKKAMSRFIAARKRYSKPIPCEPRNDIQPAQILTGSKFQPLTAMDATM
ncbi:hypothetical protein CEUSTIGMA_g12685.t1 [Chlamydomonas eustigma]|uniref:NET domain-containing protein n=1 Tax=Chlamydomonas eustigma TaxID=1157962 RepID=A0A250XQD9_9CHLO|nr:hypothetical protein CEUSTIGMA_g12685.t1 [Chlamydomonas eustigma]|eukprot:GAX85266.1 hypothetical protein CEUSTIGMA_g12685.t1 [Chlamydomonas eustigma]